MTGPAPLTVTDAATQKIASLMTDAGNTNVFLRAYIVGGGCSGFQYNFAFENEPREDDACVERTTPETSEDSPEPITVRVIVDPISLLYLQGATIDFVSDPKGERFEFHNPNAKTTCSCGSSFAA